LEPGTHGLPDDFEAVAWQRGLHALQLTANASMLRLLDLPAVLTIRLPGARGSSNTGVGYVALTQMDDAHVTVSIDGVPVTLETALFEHVWTGQARILWKDVEGLGPVLHPGARGVAVARLQELLQRDGAYRGRISGTFGPDTAAAVLEFQRSHRLDADGLVGPLTSIVLHGTTRGQGWPTLATSTGASS
jgi:hypothetical protein